MRDLNHQLKQLCRRNRDGSHATQRDRERMLSLIADQLHALGFRGMSTRSLKPKHVDALLNHWRREDLSVGTVKNRLATLRWWAQKVDRQNVIARLLLPAYNRGYLPLTGRSSGTRQLPSHTADILLRSATAKTGYRH